MSMVPLGYELHCEITGTGIFLTEISLGIPKFGRFGSAQSCFGSNLV